MNGVNHTASYGDEHMIFRGTLLHEHYIMVLFTGAMKVAFHPTPSTLRLEFDLAEDDGVYTEHISMIESEFRIDLPFNVDMDAIHPDHLALIVLLAAHPFIGSSLHIPLDVSERFALSTDLISRYNVTYAGRSLPPYTPPVSSRPGLAFSGGADSTAALLVMPENTLSVFMDRPFRKKTSLYNKSAALATIKHAQKEGHDVKTIACDVEYIRSPLGFPTDLVPSIPLLAIAAEEGIDSIAFGTVMESAYRIGHEKARDYATSHHHRFWGRMYKAAGVPLYLPVAGVSEVGTSSIVMNSSFYDYTRSCIRGTWPDACENCWKCFRKNMLDAALKKEPLNDIYLRRGLAIKEVKLKIQHWPVSHENVLAWSLKQAEGNISNLLKARFEGSSRDLSYLEGYFPPSLALMPEAYRSHTEERLNHYLYPLGEEWFETVRTHTMTSWLNSASALEAREKFSAFMDREFPRD